MLDFYRFDPGSCRFPRPAVPLLPALAWADLTLDGKDVVPAELLDRTDVRHYSRARYALTAAYRSAGAGAAGAVLLPAYHCRTMIDPALALGAPVLFYALTDALQPDINSIRTQLATGSVRAVVLTHYFGIEQTTEVISEVSILCRDHGAILIEDCSHAWQIATKRAQAGGAGSQLLVASPYKFFASEDGGVLWGAPHDLPVPAETSLMREVRAAKFVWDRNRRAHHDLPPPVSGSDDGSRGVDLVESSTRTSAHYDHSAAGNASLATSRWIMRHTRLSTVIEKRRSNYQRWIKALSILRGGRALFPRLPDGCAPYMFPLLLDQPDPAFFVLKQAGVPIWRWDDMAISGCPVSMSYRTHLLHLPCHQGLDDHQMNWMTSMVAKALA